MKRQLWCGVAAGLLVQACSYGYEGRDIQQRYSGERAECRSYAEHIVSFYDEEEPVGLAPERNRHLELVEQFARCMDKRGWQVNRPPKAKGKTGNAGRVSPYRV